MGEEKKPRKRPRKKPKDPMAGKVVWISCRARAGCEGKQAKITMRFKLPQGGTSIRYRCLTCNGVFVVTL